MNLANGLDAHTMNRRLRGVTPFQLVDVQVVRECSVRVVLALMRSQKLMKKRYKRERGGGAERRRHMTLYELISLRDMIVINTAISRDGRVEHLHAVVWDA